MAKAAVALATSFCPVGQLAREAARVLVAFRVADEERRDREADLMMERLSALEQACSFERATSDLGAFFQALVLSSELDAQAVWVSPDSETKIRYLRRLVSSIASAIESGVDASTAEILRSYYMTRARDDLAEIDACISASAR